MKVAVTGGTGFIGDYVVKNLLNLNHKVLVTGTNLNKAKEREWFKEVDFHIFKIEDLHNQNVIMEISKCDKLIHLAWQGLPNYKKLFHLERNLFNQYFFLKKIIELGLKDLTVTGTCLEYGLKQGALPKDCVTNPVIPYSIAKDTLRKLLFELSKHNKFDLKWLRLFYMYGNGQSKTSILAHLENALENDEIEFNMSGGDQIRDYSKVEKVSNEIVEYSIKNKINGVFNICSGKPISIKDLVENFIKQKSKKIKLNLGYYPYNDYEPMSFWGVK